MILDWVRLLGMLGPLAILLVMIVMALLSQRLGSVTRAPAYYLGFYVAAALLGVSILARILDKNPLAAGGWLPLLVYVGLPAAGTTIGVIVAWRYWSWLFAERS